MNIFTPLGINHTHNTRVATNHLLHISQKQTTHYGTNSITSAAFATWNDLLRNANQYFLDFEISEFKKTIFQTCFSRYSNTY